MAISIASNSESLRIQTDLQKTTNELSGTFARLSSGLRINSASDDPAGLALADSLRTDATLAAVAMRNANDGLTITAIADSALAEVSSILTRLAELANQSSNGTYSMSQRSALSSEFVALGSEIDRIARTTTFNGMNLLSNSQQITIQVGITGTSDSRISIQAVNGTLAALGLSSSGVSSQLTYSILDTTSLYAQTAAQAALTAINSAISSLSVIRGTIGAAESRLSSALNYISVARENYVAAESKIRDVDVAEEVAKLVRLQVLQQAETALLAQANQLPQLALRLLE